MIAYTLLSILLILWHMFEFVLSCSEETGVCVYAVQCLWVVHEMKFPVLDRACLTDVPGMTESSVIWLSLMKQTVLSQCTHHCGPACVFQVISPNLKGICLALLYVTDQTETVQIYVLYKVKCGHPKTWDPWWPYKLMVSTYCQPQLDSPLYTCDITVKLNLACWLLEAFWCLIMWLT